MLHPNPKRNFNHDRSLLPSSLLASVDPSNTQEMGSIENSNENLEWKALRHHNPFGQATPLKPSEFICDVVSREADNKMYYHSKHPLGVRAAQLLREKQAQSVLERRTASLKPLNAYSTPSKAVSNRGNTSSDFQQYLSQVQTERKVAAVHPAKLMQEKIATRRLSNLLDIDSSCRIKMLMPTPIDRNELFQVDNKVLRNVGRFGRK